MATMKAAKTIKITLTDGSIVVRDNPRSHSAAHGHFSVSAGTDSTGRVLENITEYFYDIKKVEVLWGDTPEENEESSGYGLSL